MQAAILPLNAGWAWIGQGYDLFRRQPMAMLFWSVATSFLINVGALIPILGQVALVILTPLLTFLTLCACRNLDHNVRMVPGLWFAPLRQTGTAGPLLRLGLAYLSATFGAAAVATLIFWSHLVTTLQAQGDKPDYAALSQAMTGPLIVFGLFYVVISALFWHTPALVGWHKLPLRRALFYSMVACWRNKFPIVIYVASWAAAYYALHWVIDQLASAGLAVTVLTWCALAADIVITALLYCSFYPVYTSIFQSPQAADTRSDQPGTEQ
ncbi:MAG TPA: BPSS1780 family membrane protein [Castellaniella sp.]|uniref:BPSS1780 family membrane protein n=1 Tax=Castellaniella sp. TaxID=1955812 RepID=UPI002F19A854